MAFWKKLFGSEEASRVDYYDEGLALLSEGKFHEALTSFRLALKDQPGDPVILQQIAIAYTRIGMTDEAAKTYRHVLSKDPAASGAHYGLAFLLLRAGQREEAMRHLQAFLDNPPRGGDAGQHVSHARSTLEQLARDDSGPGTVVNNELF
jgi:tetratricopeptide (TPR) repeat protein